MKEKWMKRIGKLLFAALLLAAGFSFGSGAAKADDVLWDVPKSEVIYRPDADMGSFNYGFGFEAGTKITNCKSTNTKVVQIRAKHRSDETNVDMKFVKYGTATVSFTAKYKTEKRSYKLKLTVRPYVNPFKSLRIGGKEYASRFEDTDWWRPYESNKGTWKKLANKRQYVKVTLKDGYKLDHMDLHNNSKGKSREVHNKSSFTITEKEQLIFNIVNTKDKKPNLFSVTLNLEK